MNQYTNIRGLLALLSAALCTAFITGCGGVSSPTDDPASPTGDVTRDIALELITKVAINEALGSDTTVAKYVEDGTSLFITAVDGGEITLPAQVDESVKNWIARTDLQPATKASLSSAYDTLKSHYLARIDAGQLNPNVAAQTRTIAEWVRDAARDTIRYGADFRYNAPAIPEDSAVKYGLEQDGSRASLRQEPVDLTLWGYFTPPETRDFLREYYSDDLAPPQNASRRVKLQALYLATEPDTSEAGGAYRTVYKPTHGGVDARAWMVYANEE